MPTLTDVLGAVLRDIASARAQSDMFSRQVSLEYARDDILRLFPVPRAEIRNAEVELGFSVSTVEQQQTDKVRIASAVLADHLSHLRDRLLRLPGKERRSREPVPLAQLLGDQRESVQASLDRELTAAVRLKNDKDIDALLQPPATAVPALERKFLASIRKSLRSIPSVVLAPSAQEELHRHAAEWSKELRDALANALDQAELEAVRLDLAVTRDQLANIPEAILARVKVTVDIENYEWTEVETEDGEHIRRLVLR